MLFRSLHETVILMTLASQEIPQVNETDCVTVQSKGAGFYQVHARYGFMESPDVPSIIAAIAPLLREPGSTALPLKMNDVTFYLGRETLIVPPREPGAPRTHGSMSPWRAELFAVMSRNAVSAAHFFGLPPNRVVELGAQIEV